MKQSAILMFTIAYILIFHSAWAQGELKVEVTHVKEFRGLVTVALFVSKNDYLKKVYRSEKVAASSEKVIATFKDLPAGDYAISIIHDKNENDKLDTNFMGIPKEGYGFGNNASSTFGPASFEDSTIHFNGENMVTSINMKYF